MTSRPKATAPRDRGATRSGARSGAGRRTEGRCEPEREHSVAGNRGREGRTRRRGKRLRPEGWMVEVGGIHGHLHPNAAARAWLKLC